MDIEAICHMIALKYIQKINDNHINITNHNNKWTIKSSIIKEIVREKLPDRTFDLIINEIEQSIGKTFA